MMAEGSTTNIITTNISENDNARKVVANAKSLHEEGVKFYHNGKLDKAFEMFKLALSMQRQYAPLSLELAETINDIGLVYEGKGELDKAEQNLTQALKLRLQLAPHSADVAESCFNIASLARAQGDLDNAVMFYNRAVAIRNRDSSNNPFQLALCLANLGHLFHDRGELDKALVFFNRVLMVYKQNPWEDGDPMLWHNCNLLMSNVLNEKKELEEVLNGIQKAPKMFLGEQKDSSVLMQIGDDFQEKGFWSKAIQSFRNVLKIQEQESPYSLDVVAICLKIGWAELQSYESGLFSGVQDLMPDSSPDLSSLDFSAGGLLKIGEKFLEQVQNNKLEETAKPYFLKAYNVFQNENASDTTKSHRPLLVYCLIGLAIIEVQSLNLDLALNYIENAISIARYNKTAHYFRSVILMSKAQITESLDVLNAILQPNFAPNFQEALALRNFIAIVLALFGGNANLLAMVDLNPAIDPNAIDEADKYNQKWEDDEWNRTIQALQNEDSESRNIKVAAQHKNFGNALQFFLQKQKPNEGDAINALVGKNVEKILKWTEDQNPKLHQILQNTETIKQEAEAFRRLHNKQMNHVEEMLACQTEDWNDLHRNLFRGFEEERAAILKMRNDLQRSNAMLAFLTRNSVVQCPKRIILVPPLKYLKENETQSGTRRTGLFSFGDNGPSQPRNRVKHMLTEKWHAYFLDDETGRIAHPREPMTIQMKSSVAKVLFPVVKLSLFTARMAFKWATGQMLPGLDDNVSLDNLVGTYDGILQDDSIIKDMPETHAALLEELDLWPADGDNSSLSGFFRRSGGKEQLKMIQLMGSSYREIIELAYQPNNYQCWKNKMDFKIVNDEAVWFIKKDDVVAPQDSLQTSPVPSNRRTSVAPTRPKAKEEHKMTNTKNRSGKLSSPPSKTDIQPEGTPIHDTQATIIKKKLARLNKTPQKGQQIANGSKRQNSGTTATYMVGDNSGDGSKNGNSQWC